MKLTAQKTHHIISEIMQPKVPRENSHTAYDPVLDFTLAQTTWSAQ